MTDHRPYRTRTSVLFAADAPKAVILRRGPRTHYHLILWDTATDTFEPGQWMKGNVRVADLSPSGGKLLYFAEQLHAGARVRQARVADGPYDPIRQRADPRPKHRRYRKIPRYLAGGTQQGRRSLPREVKGSWTATSTPPYFSALAIWPTIGRWTGGGIFLGEHEVMLWESEDGVTAIENVPMPTSVRVRASLPVARLPTSAYAPSITETVDHARLAQALLAGGLKWVDWISLRPADDMLFAGDGRIFRVAGWRSMQVDTLLSAAVTLADFREATFQQVRAPAAAMRW